MFLVDNFVFASPRQKRECSMFQTERVYDEENMCLYVGMLSYAIAMEA